MAPHKIATCFYEAGILRNKQLFLILVKLTGTARSLQAGIYNIEKRLNTLQLIHVLSEGKVLLNKITIPEGLTAQAIISKFHNELGIDSLELYKVIFDSSFCVKKNIKAKNLEGYLFPDTYYFATNVSPRQIVETMLKRFNTIIQDSIAYNGNNFNMSLHEVITLASIIEGEVMQDSERQIVSGIYHNRLNIRMYLESCPTIQYIIPDGPRRLLSRDLKIKSPYNTYHNFGLPPGPVNNPGRKSIEAALHPVETNFLFLVAKGDGSHIFSTNLSGHLKAKRKFDNLRRHYHRN